MFFYFFYFLCSPILYLFIHCIKFFNKKLYIHLKNEKETITYAFSQISKIDRIKKKVLLFHAASAGEFEQLKPILKQINRQKYFVLQTFSSPTIYTKEKNNLLFDASCYHPYDFFWSSLAFFSKIKPDAYIITRHDIWPFHLLNANRLNIKIFYINANFHKNSIWMKWYMRYISKEVFKFLTLCCVPSESIFQNANKIILQDKIIITGDSRFEQILNRYEENIKKEYLPQYFLDSKNIIFGSYDLNDENIIIESLIKCFPDGDKSLVQANQRIILVPHEIDNATILRMSTQLKKNNFTITKYSNIHTQEIATNVLIVDSIGILADIYKYAQLSYVGAGFGRGVHSVIEPAAHGCIISFGPNIELLDEAKYLFKHKLCYMISNIQDMCKFITLDIDKNEHRIMNNTIQEYLINKKHISQNIINYITQS